MVSWEESFDQMTESLHRTTAGTLDERLHRLNVCLERFCNRHQHQCTMKELKKRIKNKGICLSDCSVHGSISALRKSIRKGKSETVSLKAAKKYTYVKHALIEVFR